MFLALFTSLAGPIKLRIFPIILERMGRFHYSLHQNDGIHERQPYLQSSYSFIQFLHMGNFKSYEIVIRNIFKIRSVFAFNEKILENKAEYPIQILDYSQVFSYQNRFVK